MTLFSQVLSSLINYEVSLRKLDVVQGRTPLQMSVPNDYLTLCTDVSEETKHGFVATIIVAVIVVKIP